MVLLLLCQQLIVFFSPVFLCAKIESDLLLLNNNLMLLKNSEEQRMQAAQKNDKTTFAVLIKNSEAFNKITPFPTSANRIGVIAGADTIKQQRIVEHASQARVLVNEKCMALIRDFIAYKKHYGSKIEQSLYAGMNELAFIDRLLINRPLEFMTEADQYLLRDGTKGYGGFEVIGTDQEKYPLLLKDYISYDEMQIAALLAVSVPTYFINNGNRNNRGKPAIAGTYEEQGVYAGLVGTRFEKPGLMEWQHMIVTSEQNIAAQGYGIGADKKSLKTKYLEMWSAFYGSPLATFKEAKADRTGRFIRLNQKEEMYLDGYIYKQRMKMVIEPFLVDANVRGAEQHKKVYVHAVGLGLGVWQISPLQAKLMLEVYDDILKNRDLSHIADIDFSWFPAAYTSVGGVGNLALFTTKTNSIKIHFSKREPAEKLAGSDVGKLLVVMYAWDGNAYPGNEYWDGALTASGDPAAACCSTIPELQNPLINPNVSSKNLLVVRK